MSDHPRRTTHTIGPIYNGMPARELGSEGWSKPWSGTNGGNCVEALKLADGRVALRQSTDPDGPALIYTPHEIETFIRGAKRGEADFLLA
ncbi:DUF397 domain-containing protein [Streptomyces radicis]|uniref:DUF397 domain-containing protein n=1 Tax=Streptomyces radicis TaxID=1750517 RepID=A0A3A9VX97_9ACTN|nr:DUF397 domain-containing protein [Streptomyces radicis]RKN05370.1 DUF397 domain-containing protein [Streptomyces radicis]RKN16878.1 DUF397 domain-containing protein [Streptomyces radicis]